MRFLSLFFIFCIVACGPPKPTCPTGNPQAIFQAEDTQVAKHQFTSEGQNSTEQVQFSDGLRMEIYQSGCEKIEQEYRFFLPPGDCPSEANWWTNAAVQSFHQLGERGEAYLQYHQWASAIEEAGKEAVLGEPFLLVQSFYAEVDKLCSAQEHVLIVILSQQ